MRVDDHGEPAGPECHEELPAAGPPKAERH